MAITDKEHKKIFDFPAEAMKEPRCKNCRFWNRHWNWPTPDNGNCRKMSGSKNARALLDVVEVSFDAEIETAIAFPPDFGCVYFEVKDGKEN